MREKILSGPQSMYWLYAQGQKCACMNNKKEENLLQLLLSQRLKGISDLEFYP